MKSVMAFGDDKPKIIPASPHAQEFAKYIDYPVDYSTGLTKNEIPIYAVNCGSLVLPISINYNFSGLIPSSETGTVGLGWNLNYGGIISRTIKGLPDERNYNDTIPTDTEIRNVTNKSAYFGFLSSTSADTDTEYDLFSYTLPNQSGHFIFGRGADPSVLNTPILLPYRPVKITPSVVGSNNTELSFSFFDVFDEMGNQYRFGKSIKSGSEIYEKYQYLSSSTTAQSGKSAWMLTEMISANKADTIFFEYESILNNGADTTWITKSHHIFQNNYTTLIAYPKISPPSTDSWSSTGNYSGYGYTSKRIKTIKFKKNEVRFSYKDNHFPNSLLTNIAVYDYISSKTIKSIKLSQSKYHTDVTRLNWDKLDSVAYYGTDDKKVTKYSFEYENSISFPTIQDSYSKETYSIDHWGYYNGAQNSSPIPPDAPSYDISHVSILSGSADRNPNPNFSKAGILKKINYPEGGNASFTYTGNSIDSKVVGGLRIDQVILQTGSQQIKKTLQYNSATGISTVLPIYYLTRSGSREGIIAGESSPIWSTETYSSDVTCDITLNGRPVVYTNVIEYNGDATSYNSKI